MNYNIALLGLIEIISAITIGIFMLAVTFKIMQWVGRKYYRIEQSNLAYGIFTACIMFSVGFMINEVIQPLISSFRLMDQTTNSFSLALQYIGQGAIYIAIAFVASIVIGLLSTYLYALLTPINEFEEIRNNNVGVAIIVGTIVIVLTLLTKSGVGLLIESIIPYPQLPPK